ncbi:MAG: D-aminoacyl-tRNA deacylase [Steroidobacteraceae bacterium]
MIALLQRVSHAQVQVNGVVVGRIDAGLLVLLGIERGDHEIQADRLLERLLSYRVFADTDGKMNLSLRDQGGGLLLVPQFTLAADTQRGTRPGFSPAAPPDVGNQLFHYMVSQAHIQHAAVAAGVFGANMQVTLCNDGPVTFWLQVAPRNSDEP